jgi:hypothetical protein
VESCKLRYFNSFEFFDYTPMWRTAHCFDNRFRNYTSFFLLLFLSNTSTDIFPVSMPLLVSSVCSREDISQRLLESRDSILSRS